jgi:hypothetical protein
VTSIIRVTKINELGTKLAITSKRSTLRRKEICVNCLRFEVFTAVTMKNAGF